MQQTETPTAVTVGFEDLYLLSESGVDVFVLDLSRDAGQPPYYISAEGRRFAFTGRTFLNPGWHTALPREIQAEEAEGRLALLVERPKRFYLYLHDPAAEAEAEDGDGAEAAAE